MKRPIFWLLCFYIIGILMGRYFSSGVLFFVFASFVIVFSCCLAKFFHIKEPLFFPLAAMVGFFLFQSSGMIKNMELEAMAKEGEQIQIVGMVKDISYSSDDRQRLVVMGRPMKGNLPLLEEELKFLVYPEMNQELSRCDLVTIHGEIDGFSEKRNPGGFDEQSYYETLQFSYRIYAEKIQITGRIKKDWNSRILEFRDRVNDVFYEILPKEEAGIICALVTGDKSGLSWETKELYRDAGIYHILAISGMHISILTLLLFSLFHQYLHLNKRICSVICILFLLFYLFFTGYSVATIRAVIMCSIIMTGNLIYRDGDLFNSISIAALVILLIWPRYLWQNGFQLSFAAVIGICFGMEILEEVPVLPDSIKKYIGACFCASLMTYPLLAHYLGKVPVWGVLINLMLVPFLSIFVGFSLISGLIGLFSINIAVFTCGIVYSILKFIEAISRFFTELPYSQWYTGMIPPIFMIAFYILLILIYFYKKDRIFVQISMIGVLVFLLSGCFYSSVGKEIEVAFLDVGQGDSAVIHTYDGATFLIDGGGNPYQEFGNNQGERVVIPYFESKGIQTVDIVFLSHLDTDHAFGALEVMEKFSVKKVVLSDFDREDSQIYERMMEIAEEKNIPIERIHAGEFLELENGVRFDCLYPFANQETTDENSRSLVLKVSLHGTDFLFTGDIAKEDEEVILNADLDLEADILKVAHHGSKYSTSSLFLEQAKCRDAVISSGQNNRYGHPTPETLEALESFHINWYNTAENGAVIIKITENGRKIVPMIEGKKIDERTKK